MLQVPTQLARRVHNFFNYEATKQIRGDEEKLLQVSYQGLTMNIIHSNANPAIFTSNTSISACTCVFVCECVYMCAHVCARATYPYFRAC